MMLRRPVTSRFLLSAWLAPAKDGAPHGPQGNGNSCRSFKSHLETTQPCSKGSQPKKPQNPGLKTQVANSHIARFLPCFHPILTFLVFLANPFPFSCSICCFRKRNILADPSFRMTSVIFSQPQVVPSPYLCSIGVHARGHLPTLLGVTFILAKPCWSGYTKSQEIFPGVKLRRARAQPAYSLGLRFYCHCKEWQNSHSQGRIGPSFQQGGSGG